MAVIAATAKSHASRGILKCEYQISIGAASDRKFSCLLLIRLFQQATTGGACREARECKITISPR
jgi:hypothetical protein